MYKNHSLAAGATQGYASYTHRYAQLKKEPTAQIAHLVFADTKANAEKTKRAIFCQRSPRIMRIEI
jgi:hypothetical protein